MLLIKYTKISKIKQEDIEDREQNTQQAKNKKNHPIISLDAWFFVVFCFWSF